MDYIYRANRGEFCGRMVPCVMRKIYPANKLESVSGFTLVELVIVIVALGILSAYAVSNNLNSAEMTLPSQAQRLASDIRLAQTLAFTSGSRVQVVSATSGYSVTCVGTCASNNFNVTMKKGVTVSGTSTLEFKTNGEPLAVASYTLATTPATSTKIVSVEALTGLVSVAP